MSKPSKVCDCCEQRKHLTKFYKNPNNTKDGHQNVCIACKYLHKRRNLEAGAKLISEKKMLSERLGALCFLFCFTLARKDTKTIWWGK